MCILFTQINVDNSDGILKQLVKEEDIEEISDEEAEWSDDGDCMFPLDFDVDFDAEDQWEEPIKIFDCFSPSLNLNFPLKHFTLRTFCEDYHQSKLNMEEPQKCNETNDEIKLDANLDSLAVKKIITTLKQLQKESVGHTKMLSKDVPIGNDWVETIEKLTSTLVKDSKESIRINKAEIDVILEALRIGLSIDHASKQPKPTYKLRHLKSSLKLLYEMLLLEQSNFSSNQVKFVSTKSLLQDGLTHRLLLEIFKDKYTASTIRLLVLKIFDLTLNSAIGIKFMLQKYQKLGKIFNCEKNASISENTQECYSDQTETGFTENSKEQNSITGTFIEELLQYLADNTCSTRLRYALTALVAKINLHETLEKMSSIANKVSQEKFVINAEENNDAMEEICDLLHQTHAIFMKAKSTIAQPKSTHFLPLTKVLESQNERKPKVTKYGGDKPGNNDLIDPYPGFFFLLRQNKTLNALLIFMGHPILSSNALVCAAVRSLLHSILQHPVGMVYLNGGAIVGNEDAHTEVKEHFQVLAALSKTLLQQSAISEAVEQEDISQPGKSNQSVGIQLNYAVHALNLIDQLYSMCSGSTDRKTLEKMDILDTIQTLHGMTFNASGKLAVTRILTTGNNLEIIIRFVKHSGELKEGNENATKKDMKRSAIRGYACELLLLVVRTSENLFYLDSFASELLSIGRADETSKLHELISWVSPIEDIKINSSYLSSLCEVVKSNCESVSPMSHELVTAVRAINCICLPDLKISSSDNGKTSNVSGKKFPMLPSLDLSVIYLYSAGLIEAYVTVLEKIWGYHEQPHLHIATFVGHNGYVLLSVIKPVVQTLAVILNHLIACQDNGFRDISSINVLLRTFTLCNVVPVSSSCYDLSRTVCADIMQIMLSLTSTSFVQPTNTSLQICRKEDSGGLLQEGKDGPVNKQMNSSLSLNNASMWQKMIAEVIKYTLGAPHTYLTGLRIFSELLPLPLPIQTKFPLSKEENETAENIRRLWSVRVYACETLVKEMVIKLGGIGASCSSLVHLLRRVCVQLADLSPPIAKIVAEALIDGFKVYYDADKHLQTPHEPGYSAQQTETSTIREKMYLCSSQTSRILNLLMWLLSNGSVKSAFIEVISSASSLDSCGQSNGHEAFLHTLLRILNISKSNSDGYTQTERQQLSESHTRSQDYVVGIVQMLLDPEISMLPITQDSESSISEKHLANSLPQQDQYSLCLNGLIEYITSSDVELEFSNLAPAIRTLVMISYQNYGFLMLKKLLLERPNTLHALINKHVKGFEGGSKLSSPDCFNAITAICEFLRIIIGMSLDAEITTNEKCDEIKVSKEGDSHEESVVPVKRNICLTKHEILKVFRWFKPEKKEISTNSEPEPAPIQPKSFSIGSLFGSLKRNSHNFESDHLNHPLILLQQLISKVTNSNLIKKEHDESMDVDQVASIENEADMLREQLALIIQQLNNLAENNSPDKEPDNESSDVKEESELTLPQADSLLTQFRQRPVYELTRPSIIGPTSYGNGEIECSAIETEAINEDERLNSCYWNITALEDSNNDEHDTMGNTMDVDHSTNEQLVRVNLIDLALAISSDPKEAFDLTTRVRQVCDEKSLFETEASKLKKKPKKSLLEAKALANQKLISTFNAGGAVPGLSMGRGRGFHRTSGQRLDAFRSRPANTSRPPSLHVDDFLILQMRGQQPQGPTGYNRQSVKAAQELFAEREAKSKGAMVGFRDVTKAPVYCDETSQEISGISHSAGKPNLNMGWNIRGGMNSGPRGAGRFMRGQGRGGGFGSFSSGRGGWNTYSRSDYGRNSVIQGGNGGNVSNANQERRFSMNENSGNSNQSMHRRSTDRSSKDRNSGGSTRR